MVGYIWRRGGEGDEVGEGANGIEGALEGGVRGNGGLEANSVGKGVSLSSAVAEEGRAWQGIDRGNISVAQEPYAKETRAIQQYLLSTDSSAHGSLEGYELANIRRRNRSFSSSIILTLRTLGHPHTAVLWQLMYSKILSKTHCRGRLLVPNLDR